jgi:hypothetical protein
MGYAHRKVQLCWQQSHGKPSLAPAADMIHGFLYDLHTPHCMHLTLLHHVWRILAGDWQVMDTDALHANKNSSRLLLLFEVCSSCPHAHCCGIALGRGVHLLQRIVF